MFFHHLRGRLVAAQRDESRVAEVVAFGPFGEFDLGHEPRAEPLDFLHDVTGYRFTTSRASLLRKIIERTFRGSQSSKMFRHVAS